MRPQRRRPISFGTCLICSNADVHWPTRITDTLPTFAFVGFISLGFVLSMSQYLFLLILDITIVVMLVLVAHGGLRGGVVRFVLRTRVLDG